MLAKISYASVTHNLKGLKLIDLLILRCLHVVLVVVVHVCIYDLFWSHHDVYDHPGIIINLKVQNHTDWLTYWLFAD